MSFLLLYFLRAFHLIYSICLFICSFWRHTDKKPILKGRRIPKHLALVLVFPTNLQLEEYLVGIVTDVVVWCRSLGIEKLTIYDEHGEILKCSQQIRNSILGECSEVSSESEIEFPLTPPPSDCSESRSISPQNGVHTDSNTIIIHLPEKPVIRRCHLVRGVQKRRHIRSSKHFDRRPLILCLTSRNSSKPLIALVAQSFAWKYKSKVRKVNDAFTISGEELDQALEVSDGLSSPDFMIVHPLFAMNNYEQPPELHGYPPWHIRLTEIYHSKRCNRPPVPPISQDSKFSPKHTLLDESMFHLALDEFSSAEMRFGK